MYSKRNILTFLASVLILSIATTNAGLVQIEILSSGGSGGGGNSGGGIPVLIGTYLDQNIDFKGFSMSGHSSNWNSGNTLFTGRVYVEDGFYNNSFLYADMTHDFYGDIFNERTVYTYIGVSFYSHKGLYSAPGSNLVKPIVDYKMGTNINFPGMDISINSEIHSGNGTDQFPNLFMPYLDFKTVLWVEDGTIERMNMEPFWNLEDGRLYTRFFLTIGLTGELDDVSFFTSSLQELPPELATQFVPEPATMFFLGVGGLLLRRRRN